MIEYRDVVKIETLLVPDLVEKMRLSELLPGLGNCFLSNKSAKKAIKNGLVTVNGNRGYSGDFILGGETIEIFRRREQTVKPVIDLNIPVVYEDEYLAIVNKPAGILVSGNKKMTIENALSGVLQISTKSKDALLRPEPIHRLDYPTSGALLIGKTAQTVVMLNKLFEKREISKTYYAVTVGEMQNNGTVNALVDNKEAKTEFEIVDRLISPKYEYLNLVKLTPFSGRRHQIRKHLAEIGNPIMGDKLYGKEGLIHKGKGLYLHASSIQFIHPVTYKELFIEVSLPKKFKKLFKDY